MVYALGPQTPLGASVHRVAAYPAVNGIRRKSRRPAYATQYAGASPPKNGWYGENRAEARDRKTGL